METLSSKEKRISGDFKDKRWCHLHYHIQEVAEIMNISLNKLRLICSKDKIRLDTLTFKELVSFVQKYKGKKKLPATSPL